MIQSKFQKVGYLSFFSRNLHSVRCRTPWKQLQRNLDTSFMLKTQRSDSSSIIFSNFIVFFQERRALLFCQEDRAILCRECDVPIHRSNEHTQKHNRFLLTGVKLSASSSSNQASSSSSALSTDMKSSRSSAKRQNCPPSSLLTAERSLPLGAYQDENHTSDAGSISTSSISEYLMETLPGWHVDEFLDPSSTASNVYCKVCLHSWSIRSISY